MADRECDASVGRAPEAPPARGGSETAAPSPCPECAFPQVSLVSDGDLVSVFKCPRCGHLTAPLKSS